MLTAFVPYTRKSLVVFSSFLLHSQDTASPILLIYLSLLYCLYSLGQCCHSPYPVPFAQRAGSVMGGLAARVATAALVLCYPRCLRHRPLILMTSPL